MSVTVLLCIIGVTALVFDFTNGFHDTANAMVTSIATGAPKPKVAVALAGVLNLVGAFLSVEVAKTIAEGIVRLDQFDLSDTLQSEALLMVVLAGVGGGILWNLFTWVFGIPSSSSHALFGGLIGSGIAAIGFGGVVWNGVLNKIIVPALAAPFVAGLVALAGTWLVYRITANTDEEHRDKYFRWGQIGSASLVALAHGTSDAQKTMGVIFLAFVASGHLNPDDPMPFWIQLACALAIAAGTYSGGSQVIRTLGKGLVEIHPPQGMAAETSSAAIILTSSHLGMALSTTHVATGSIMGSGLAGPKDQVRWVVAARMVLAWVTTLPIAALVAALVWWVSHLVTTATGNIVVGGAVLAALIALASGYMFFRANKNPVTEGNINDDWDGGLDPASSDHAPKRARRVYSEPGEFVDTSAGLRRHDEPGSPSSPGSTVAEPSDPES